MNKCLNAIIIIAVISVPTVGLCDIPQNNSLQSIQDIYMSTASGWERRLSEYALRLFWLLAFIDFVWMAINLTLAPGEFSDLFANVIRKVLFIGFFLLLLQRGPEWADAIIRSFQTAASNLTSGSVGSRPADIFDLGFNLTIKIFDEMSFWSPGDALGYVIAGYLIMIIFALIAAMTLMITVQTTLVMFAGIILLGFGGSTFTKEISLAYYRAALSNGVKLFVMMLITRLGVGLINNWALTLNNITFKQMALFIGAGVVLLALVKSIPDMVGDMINGFSWGSGEALASSGIKTGKSIVGGAVGAIAGGVGAGMAIKEAAKMASGSNSSGIAGKAMHVAKSVGKASAQQIGQQISGQGPKTGTVAGRTAAILKENRLSSSSTQPSSNNSINKGGS